MLIDYFHDTLLETIVLVGHQQGLDGRDKSIGVSFCNVEGYVVRLRKRLRGPVFFMDVGNLTSSDFAFFSLLILFCAHEDILVVRLLCRLLQPNSEHLKLCRRCSLPTAVCRAARPHERRRFRLFHRRRQN